MANIEKLRENLKREGFLCSCFETVEETLDYMDRMVDHTSVGFGGSQTVRDMGLFERLCAHNDCCWHWDAENGVVPPEATNADIYICSLNGVSENGELVNIDGRGNRLASNLYGHKKVYFIIGENKIVPDYDAALWRARNIAAPQNARRLGVKTPCAVTGKCENCSSPDRICRALLVYWETPLQDMEIEVVIVRQSLGF